MTSIAADSSPFRESDWDRKLDHLIEDLERSGSRSEEVGRGGGSGVNRVPNFDSSSRSGQIQEYNQSHIQSMNSSAMRSQSSSSAYRSQKTTQGVTKNYSSNEFSATNNNNYPLSKSKSTNSIQEGTDNMLKDLEGSLNASSNYIESYSRSTGPSNVREYHEYRSYSSSNGGNNNLGNNDFDLERQVQHMMPSNYNMTSTNNTNSGLQSANMVSSMQQQYSSSYKMQSSSSNQYSSRDEKFTTSTNYPSQQESDDRPGSRLKQNIDELDTLLSDLNNARKMSDAGADYTASSITPGNMSSDDYSFNEGHQGHVKKTINTYNEHSYQSSMGGDYSSRKPPSPSPRRRGPTGSISSPSAVRRSSPGPSNTKTTSSSYNYTASSSYSNHDQLPQSTILAPSSTVNYDPPSVPKDGNPTGVSYYTKYHSSHTHQSQGQGPASFPSNSLPKQTPPQTQAPPKRVDELMTELSEFDSSIQHTGFVEPAEPVRKNPSPERYRYREPSPERQIIKQQNTPGPAVYYPPGEMFTTSKADYGSKGKAKAKYSYKSKEKSKGTSGESKEGAAVVPICLPVCCATPCVIM